MTDIFENQTAFEGTTPPSAEGGKPNGKTPRRKARSSTRRRLARGEPKTVPAPVAAEPAKKRGRPAGAKSAKGGRGRPAGAKAPSASPTNGTGKLLLSVVGLDEAETSFVAAMLAALENHPKKSRAKIVASLGRIFA